MDEKIKAHCNTCGGKKNHLVLHTEVDVTDEESWITFSTYRLIKCAGCDRVHLQHETDFSGLTDSDGNPVMSTVYYPPPVSRRRPEWMPGSVANVLCASGTDIGQLLTEVYGASERLETTCGHGHPRNCRDHDDRQDRRRYRNLRRKH